jgi:hypothetical protein
MVFSREQVPARAPTRDELTAAMVGIGIGFAASAAPMPNIEDTLWFASAEAVERNDLRMLALLVSWFGVHHPWVNADRLTRLVSSHGSERARAVWSAIARWQGKDRRFARLARCYRGSHVDLLGAGTEFQVRRHGEDPRFKGSCLRAPANLLRDRPGDVASPEELAKRHRGYHHRVMIGPSYRADCWAALEAEPDLSAADLARRTYASFATAWHVRRDFAIVGWLRRRSSLQRREPVRARRATSRSRSRQRGGSRPGARRRG